LGAAIAKIWSQLNPAQTKCSLGYDYPHREGAAGHTLTVGTVAGVNQLRCLDHLVADLAAMAAACLRELHRSISPRQGRRYQPAHGIGGCLII
jgi:hypothetical protein